MSLFNELKRRNDQFSYLGIFESYYAAIGDKRALALLLTISYRKNTWIREIEYRYQTDNSFSLAAYNSEIKEKATQNNSKVGEIIPEIALESIAENS